MFFGMLWHPQKHKKSPDLVYRQAAKPNLKKSPKKVVIYLFCAKMIGINMNANLSSLALVIVIIVALVLESLFRVGKASVPVRY